MIPEKRFPFTEKINKTHNCGKKIFREKKTSLVLQKHLSLLKQKLKTKISRKKRGAFGLLITLPNTKTKTPSILFNLETKSENETISICQNPTVVLELLGTALNENSKTSSREGTNNSMT